MKFFAKTDFGKVRKINQDYYIAENRKVGIFPNIFIVADGVGSNRESGYASKHCSNFVLDQLSLSKDSFDYIEELKKAYRLANTDLVYRIIANPSYKGMGTTMVAASIIGERAIVANIGDSRCYLIRSDIRQITRDHSVAEELVLEHAIERNSEKYLELKSQLSRAMGASKKIEPDFFEFELMYGDYLLLCSDGLSNMVSNEKLEEIIRKKSNLESKVDELINEANANGGKDNIAIILIYIDSPASTNAVFEREKMALNKEAIAAISNDKSNVPHENIKEILDQRALMLKDNFRSRSRKRQGGDSDESKL